MIIKIADISDSWKFLQISESLHGNIVLTIMNGDGREYEHTIVKPEELLRAAKALQLLPEASE